MKRTVLMAALALVAATSCKKNEVTTLPADDRGRNGIAPGGCFPPPIDCSNTVCTANFADVGLEVKDALGNPVTLDSFVVTEPNGAALALSPSGLPVWGNPNAAGGTYSVINDAWVQGHQGTFASVRARGWKGGNEVFNELITISADCCHVSRMNGVATITLP